MLKDELKRLYGKQFENSNDVEILEGAIQAILLD